MKQNTFKTKKVKYGNKTGTKKRPHFGNYDIYSNPKPRDTVRIKYATVNDVIFTNTYRFALIVTIFPLFYLIQTFTINYFF